MRLRVSRLWTSCPVTLDWFQTRKVAMDCMSYTPATKEIAHRWIKAPILLAITATTRVLRELLD